MKRLLALILALCICVAVLSSCASYADEDENEKVEVPTSPTEPKEFADATLASKVKGGMTRENVKKLLGVEGVNCNSAYHENAEAYRLDDGRAVYIIYSKNGVVEYFSIHKMVDPSHLDQIKEGYHYDKITEIFGGVDGITITSSGMGTQLYILSDGRALFIDYDFCYFSTGMSITSADGKTEILGTPSQKWVTLDDFDSLKQHLATSYKGIKIAIPTLVSSEYKFGKALDTKACFSYSFGPAAYSIDDQEYYDSEFRIEVSKIDILYEDMLDYYDKEDRNELIEFREGVTFVKNWGRFLFDNNGRVITVDIPLDLREEKTHLRDENSPPAITTLEELEKYLVIEYLDLPCAEE